MYNIIVKYPAVTGSSKGAVRLHVYSMFGAIFREFSLKHSLIQKKKSYPLISMRGDPPPLSKNRFFPESKCPTVLKIFCVFDIIHSMTVFFGVL